MIGEEYGFRSWFLFFLCKDAEKNYIKNLNEGFLEGIANSFKIEMEIEERRLCDEIYRLYIEFFE